jgi:hypothetical protein
VADGLTTHCETCAVDRPPRGVAVRLVSALLRLYQATLSRALGPRCRFHPSCSQYTLEAVTRYGVVRGAWLGLRRVSRCHPFHAGGFDPVP